MSVPIIFIHTGPIFYLYETIYQLKKTNPEIDIHLIGTKETKIYNRLLNHHDISEYDEQAKDFSTIYKHLSDNSYSFELFCIQRWFMLYEFMKKNKIERCLHLDTDVLLYYNVNELLNEYGDKDWSICGISGHCSFMKREVLGDICEYILHIYSKSNIDIFLNKMLSNYRATVPNYNISDMTWLEQFAKEYPNRVINSWVIKNNAVCDASLNSGEGLFEMEGTYKKIVWKSGYPFFVLINQQKLIKAWTIHFQGGETKRMITKCVRAKTWNFYLNQYYFKIQWYKYRILKKIGQ